MRGFSGDFGAKFQKSFPIFPSLSTYTKFAIGQNRVTERKSLSRPESDLAFRKTEKERTTMSSKNNNQLNIPQARDAGSVGGQMVKTMCPIRNVFFNRNVRTAIGHTQIVEYIASISV